MAIVTRFTLLLLALVGLSFAEIPPQNILWGVNGPPAPSPTKASNSFRTARAAGLDPRDTVCTNTPTSRKCWASGYSVATDFDAKWPNTGKTVSYSLEITNSTCNPDGNGDRLCLLVNGKYPGPTLRANWGDTLSVTVKNSMQDNGTSIHWHGIRQLNSGGMDGTNGLTECPLAPKSSKTYTFKCTQFGTTWYHSHYSAQYGDGVAGAIQIDGPTTSDYDVDLGPYFVNDWYYRTAYQVNDLANINLQKGGPPPPPDTILINGTNKNAAGGGAYGKTTLEKGKKYLLRIINPSVDNYIRVSLDKHPFTVVTSDLVPIHPYTTDWLLLAIGQRYEVIITANQTVDNYWFRAEVEGNCFSANNGAGKSIFSYSGASSSDPTSTGTTKPSNCNEESPLVPWVVNNVPSDNFTSQVRNLQVDISLPGTTTNNQNVVVWSVNMTAIDVDWEMPTFSYVQTGNTSYPVSENLIELKPGIWAYWIIQETAATLAAIPHPIHLHGHDFYVLGSGSGQFSNSSVSSLNFANPTRRDVTSLPAGGWLVLAFPTDNPGSWLMHCHIAWHVGEGLGVQFLENVAAVPNLIPSDYNNVCAAWKTYYDGNPAYKKDDSGI